MTMQQTKLPKGLASLTRPKFNAGQFLQDDDLTQIIAYTQGLSSLLFRSMLGCGVLCGLKVSAVYACRKLTVTVARGVALACDGSVIELPADQSFVIDPTCGEPIPPEIWVALCRYEQPCAPRETQCADEDDMASSAMSRVREGYEIKIYDARPENVCGCDPHKAGDASCYESHVAGECACGCTCGCVMLARVDFEMDSETPVAVDHSVRRFIRPALLPDPLLVPDVPPPPPPPPVEEEFRFALAGQSAQEDARKTMERAVERFHATKASGMTITGYYTAPNPSKTSLALLSRRVDGAVAALVSLGIASTVLTHGIEPETPPTLTADDPETQYAIIRLVK